MSGKPRQLRIFLCHASADKPAVQKLYRYLRSKGMDPWLDEMKLVPGQRWETEISKAVSASDAIIVFLSKSSITKEGFVQREIKFALDKMSEVPEGRICLIPARLEQCEVPDSLKGYEWVDLFQKNGNRRLMLSLNERAKQLGLDLSSALEGETQVLVTGTEVEPEQELELKKLESRSIQPKLSGGFRNAIIIGAVVFILAAILSSLVWGKRFLPTATDRIAFTPCAPHADVLFNYVINQSTRIASALGKQTRDHPRCIESSYQSFDGGEMIWRSDDPDIYILYANHDWSSYKNDFVFKNPTEVPCNVEPPTRDRFQPYLGFGKIWCDHQSVREKLGYATIGENQDDRAILTFENGWLMLINYTVQAVFHDGKQWESVDVFKFAQISLESRPDLDAKISNLGLEQERSITLPKASLQALDPVTGKSLAVPFRVGSKVSTQCDDRPEYPETIQILTNIPHPVRVYLLIQAGWGVKSYEYRTIGNISLKFDDGEPFETPLILGYNIRDWADRSVAITTLVSTYSQTAWEGFDEVPGRIDLLILDIPEGYTSSTLREIQIDDRSKLSTGGMDPCIHLSAVTVSHLP